MIQSLVAVLVIAVVLIVDLVTKAAVAGSMDRGDSITVIDARRGLWAAVAKAS